MTNYDFRAKFEQTVHEINPTITVEKIERTVPSYARANPYRAGILGGERMELEEILYFA